MNKKMLGSILGALAITAAPALARADDEKTEAPAPKKKDAAEKGHHKGADDKGKGGEKSCGGDKKGGDKSCGGEKSCGGDKKGGEKSCGAK